MQNWTVLEFVEDRDRFAFPSSMQKKRNFISEEKSLSSGWELALWLFGRRQERCSK